MKRILAGILTCLSGLLLYGQNEMIANDFNFSDFSKVKKEVTPELNALTPQSFYNHPEYGTLYSNAPCENCYELIHKRTDSTKHFVEKGSEGTKFYIQKANGPLHYQDAAGNFLTYDGQLQPTSNPLIFTADKQDTPISLDLANQHTSIALTDGNHFRFNHVELLHKNSAGVETSLGMADWSNYTIGHDGIQVIDAWPGIDMVIRFSLDRVKTNYVIKENLGLSDGTLIFRDQMDFPSSYNVYTDEENAEITESGALITTYEIQNSESLLVYIDPAYGYDQSGLRENSQAFGYTFENHELAVHVPVNWMNDPSKVYPLVVDPAVTSTATYTAGIMRFRFNGSFCGGPNADCTYNLVVPRPANSTINGATFNIVQETLYGACFGCWMSEAGFYFSTTCGLNGYWSCNLNAQGTCTATNLDISNLVTCLAPACSGNVTFSIFNSYCYCSTGGNCGNSCQRINNSTWSITISGSTAETLGNTASGNGSTTINPVGCTGSSMLDPAAANGVPGYTYNWSTGASTPTISVPNSPDATYTCIVTDACGVSRTATFTVEDCVTALAVELTEFYGEQIDQSNVLFWKTKSESENSHFIIEKKMKDGTYQEIGKVKGQMTSSTGADYEFADTDPFPGINIYRLVSVDINGEKEYADPISVYFENDQNMMLIPNPANDQFTLKFHFPYTGEFLIQVSSTRGEIVKEIWVNVENLDEEVLIDCGELKDGVYVVNLITRHQNIQEKLLIQH